MVASIKQKTNVRFHCIKTQPRFAHNVITANYIIVLQFLFLNATIYQLRSAMLRYATKFTSKNIKAFKSQLYFLLGWERVKNERKVQKVQALKPEPRRETRFCWVCLYLASWVISLCVCVCCVLHPVGNQDGIAFSASLASFVLLGVRAAQRRNANVTQLRGAVEARSLRLVYFKLDLN